ncbi:glycine betaine ABC transporter substrate-binding protein [Roseiterribacter gracilis]|uniref:Amino acid ABC transporter permease n=1 Tax=Roseiterribacter gracilis TaxID=2812848 RepID=A0A8S8X769_9PROT|nr:amino acid ABC transporter permease [Rhodospirillales bacterium TMPK1]
MRWILLIALLLTHLLWAPASRAETIRVGAKNFTEQWIVGELYAQALERAGITVERRFNLAGSAIAHAALVASEIDLYPEYTGTALAVVLKEPARGEASDTVLARVRAFYQREIGATWLTPSGIDNGNVLLMRPGTQVADLSALARIAPKLTIGLGTEFVDRDDGLPGLERVYGMKFGRVATFSALALRYDALTRAQVDVINGFATDWQIADGALVALADDLALFPPYQLAPVVRNAALTPRIASILDAVSARLDTATMQRLNGLVERDRFEPAEVAQAFLDGVEPTRAGLPWSRLARATLEHAGLALASIVVGLAVALPLALLAARRDRLRATMLGFSALFYAVPSLALFALLLPLTGLGTVSAVIGLSLYAAMVLLRGLLGGLAALPPQLDEVATGLGLTPRQRLLRVTVPLLLPAFVASLRTALVAAIGLATIAAAIDAGGLGQMLLTGLAQRWPAKIALSAGAAVLLALLADRALLLLERQARSSVA